MDIERIRKDFPILETGVIFFDSAATSLTPEQVVNAQNEYYHEFNANIARGVYEFSTIATERYEEAHGTIAKFLGAKDNEIIITKNSTESINQVAYSFPWGARKKIVTTLIEHHSNYLPWLRVAQIYGLEVATVKPNEEGIFNLKDFEKVIDSNTALVAVNHVSNVLGTINTVEEIIQIAHRKGAKVIADGAQAAPHIPVDLHKMDVDFYVTSGHKMLGPTGTGVLYIKEELFNYLRPALLGGGTITDVDIGEYKLVDNFERFEAGTPNIAGGLGLAAAAEYLMNLGMENVLEHEKHLMIRMIEGLKSAGIKVFGPSDYERRVGVVSFEIEGMGPHRAAFLLSEMFNIAVRSGHHCAYPLLKHVICRPEGTCRASLYIYNTEEEVERFIGAIKEIRRSSE